MVRAGLGESWNCLFANDFDAKKCETYRRNWGPSELVPGDVRSLTPADLPGRADLAWASFPCQDLSLAGHGAGLDGERSGAFWPFWNLIESLVGEGRAPGFVVLENVCGAMTSHGGEDFRTICTALTRAGYWVGAMVIDAALFLPQSRPRLFFLASFQEPQSLPCLAEGPGAWHPEVLRSAHRSLSPQCRARWVWWNFPAPAARAQELPDLIEDSPASVAWHSTEQTECLLSMMSAVNRAKVDAARRAGVRRVGTVYRRTRRDSSGARVQRAEVRFDGVAGCLRTPAGGSSRQSILVVEGASTRSRLLSSRETARLMGLPDSYELPAQYNEAYHLTGDGVAVPVVRHIAAQLIEPMLLARGATPRLAARRR